MFGLEKKSQHPNLFLHLWLNAWLIDVLMAVSLPQRMLGTCEEPNRPPPPPSQSHCCFPAHPDEKAEAEDSHPKAQEEESGAFWVPYF